MKKYIVITTIHDRTKAINEFEAVKDWQMILVGDKKSVPIASSEKLTFLSVDDQTKLGYKFHQLCPYNHYSRKNIGYLYAISQGAEIIYDTDDDNIPKSNWCLPEFKCKKQIHAETKYLNVYRYFTGKQVWPRGYPLDLLLARAKPAVCAVVDSDIGVWQGLADNDPDVDAVYRLVINKKITFADKDPVFIRKGIYCPFNSQNTFWNKELFPLLYLPATVSFRFTDILRGYVAQKLMWNRNLHLGFTGATVYQDRNEHNLTKDFQDEIECYLFVKPVVELLDSMPVIYDLVNALRHVYDMLAHHGFVKKEEITILNSWLDDYSRLTEKIYAKD